MTAFSTPVCSCAFDPTFITTDERWTNRAPPNITPLPPTHGALIEYYRYDTDCPRSYGDTAVITGACNGVITASYLAADHGTLPFPWLHGGRLDSVSGEKLPFYAHAHACTPAHGHTHMHTRTHTHTHIYIHTITRTCTHAHIHTHTHAHAYMHKYHTCTRQHCKEKHA